ncbi:MAG: radical SAM protein [Candidatus Thorarchaeota archaeon]|nr:MAG: radical SAM protein [Candidatus Thorarchaeota archaeon]
MTFPSDIRIQITSRCNHNCGHCFASSNNERVSEELSDDVFLRVIDQINREELNAISITGGEPLIRPKLVFKILEQLRNHPATKTLNTNGWFLTKSLATRLKEAGLNITQISLDSSIEHKHDSFRELKGSHKRALKAIENSVQAGLETHVRTTITSFNYDEMPAILEMSLKKGADRLVVKPLISSGRGSLSCEPLSSEQHRNGVADLMNQIRVDPNLTPNHVQFLTPCFPFLVDQEYAKYSEPCECGKSLVFIAFNGDVQPCGYAHLTLGNLLETSLENLWSNSPHLLEWRANRLNGECLVCKFGEICQGGCRAAAYEATATLTSVDPICWLEDSK